MVCAMFVCGEIQEKVFNGNPVLQSDWDQLNRTAKGFRWPDKPVLFDRLESTFISSGCDSSLMFLHKSPGLLRVKQNHI
jgi:hypothetical protein